MTKTGSHMKKSEDFDQYEGSESELLSATTLLQQDHDQVEDLFVQFEQAIGEPAQQKALARQVFQSLKVHTQIEEEFFYPAVQTQVYEEENDLVEDSRQEHQAVENLIQELQKLQPEDEDYQDIFHNLMSYVRTHVEMEENEMFSDAEEQLGDDELQRLGALMYERKLELLTATR